MAAGAIPLYAPASSSAYSAGALPREQRYDPGFNTERYDEIEENAFLAVGRHPLSTFAADVDTASYANVRRFINEKNPVPKGAVRIEEMLNYFAYDYPAPGDEALFSVSTEVAASPWTPEHRLLRIGIRGEEIPEFEREPANLVFLIDVSGSMSDPDKLPLVKRSLQMLAEQLDGRDRIAMVVYAGAAGMALPSTPCSETAKIVRALDDLKAGGSTNGGQGIKLAYKTARNHFIQGGINRVILATDGDFNVGVTNESDLVDLIEENAKSGVFLTVLGYGTGNLNDSNLEKLANKGNGNYAYIDSLLEARKALVEEMGGSLVTIAKDVKFQVEFNPATVQAHRLLGYENRLLADEDFNDDTKDAGEIGAGHRMTALYEIVPAGVKLDLPGVDPLKYQKTGATHTPGAASGELCTVKIRYKQPSGSKSSLISHVVPDDPKDFSAASADFKFAASVAAFGMWLRDSQHRGTTSKEKVLAWAEAGRGLDRFGYRNEFMDLVRRARRG